jgi:Zn-dependent protease/predicted transcriptional regulator
VRWSFRLGTVAGIPLFVHATFPLLLAWVVFVHARQGASLAATLAGLLFVLALFGCVVLHEFGHALTARRYGIVTRDITLLPIGGLARLTRMPREPGQELRVALAGPAVNVGIALLLWGLLALTGGGVSPLQLGVAEGPFLQRLLVVNVSLAVFNLLPAFPMDGGRVLRALLATRLPYVRATRIAATAGQGMALLFGFVGLLANPLLLFIALFVWIGASQEAATVEMGSSLAGVPVRSAMLTEFRVLRPHDTLQHAVELILAGSQQDFPVVDQDRVVGLLLRSELIAALPRTGTDAAVATVMRTDFETATSEEALDAALPRLRTGPGPMPVLEGDRLVGLVTSENVGEFLAIQASLAKA